MAMCSSSKMINSVLVASHGQHGIIRHQHAVHEELRPHVISDKIEAEFVYNGVYLADLAPSSMKKQST